jgi:hypothetical protein
VAPHSHQQATTPHKPAQIVQINAAFLKKLEAEIANVKETSSSTPFSCLCCLTLPVV